LRCKAICTTHFLEIFTLGLLRDDVHGMRVLQMAVRIPSATGDNAVPLFKLEKGVASSSAGLVCAKMAGVNKQIVARAGEVLAAMKEGESVKPVPDDLNSNSIFQERTKSMLRFFLGMDSWVDDDDLRLLQEKIMMV
jgi:DNA mismatch repair protein MSH5